MSQPISIIENEGAEETAGGERDVFCLFLLEIGAFVHLDLYLKIFFLNCVGLSLGLV